jgi:hypothetical protein
MLCTKWICGMGGLIIETKMPHKHAACEAFSAKILKGQISTVTVFVFPFLRRSFGNSMGSPPSKGDFDVVQAVFIELHHNVFFLYILIIFVENTVFRLGIYRKPPCKRGVLKTIAVYTEGVSNSTHQPFLIRRI